MSLHFYEICVVTVKTPYSSLIHRQHLIQLLSFEANTWNAALFSPSFEAVMKATMGFSVPRPPQIHSPALPSTKADLFSVPKAVDKLLTTSLLT